MTSLKNLFKGSNESNVLETLVSNFNTAHTLLYNSIKNPNLNFD